MLVMSSVPVSLIPIAICDVIIVISDAIIGIMTCMVSKIMINVIRMTF